MRCGDKITGAEKHAIPRQYYYNCQSHHLYYTGRRFLVCCNATFTVEYCKRWVLDIYKLINWANETLDSTNTSIPNRKKVIRLRSYGISNSNSQYFTLTVKQVNVYTSAVWCSPSFNCLARPPRRSFGKWNAWLDQYFHSKQEEGYTIKVVRNLQL